MLDIIQKIEQAGQYQMSKKKRKKNQPVERICNNCELFNRESSTCKIVILYEGKKINIPVYPQDSCFFEDKFVAREQEIKNDEIVEKDVEFTPADEIKQIRIWTEDPKTGEPTDGDGVVKIEYPDDIELRDE